MLNWDEYNTEETNQVAQKAPAQTKEEKEVIVKLEEIVKQDGSVLVGAGKSLDNYDPMLDQTDFLIEGVVGSIT